MIPLLVRINETDHMYECIRMGAIRDAAYKSGWNSPRNEQKQFIEKP